MDWTDACIGANIYILAIIWIQIWMPNKQIAWQIIQKDAQINALKHPSNHIADIVL